MRLRLLVGICKDADQEPTKSRVAYAGSVGWRDGQNVYSAHRCLIALRARCIARFFHRRIGTSNPLIPPHSQPSSSCPRNFNPRTKCLVIPKMNTRQRDTVASSGVCSVISLAVYSPSDCCCLEETVIWKALGGIENRVGTMTLNVARPRRLVAPALA